MQEKPTFTRYEIFIISILTILQFTVILDFMVLSPLGAILMPVLDITPAQFGMVVSAYAISAGVSGLFAAGFADKYDRKKLLLFFYSGFIIGTLLCGIAPNYTFLLAARIVTGIFGGVLGSVCYAIVTDLFKIETRGRVMGFLQMAFAGSQVLGLPIGLYLANLWGWHSPFLLIVAFSLIVYALILFKMMPVNTHLLIQKKQNAFVHLANTVSNSEYLKGFTATILLATGGFMLMPFATAYSVNNLGISIHDVPLLYMFTGIFSMAVGPLVGRLTDSVGKFNVFMYGSLLTIAITLVYCNLGVTAFWLVVIVNVIMFIGVTSRMISSQALLTAVPEPQDRGAFMSINSSVMQISGGVATFIAGLIVVQTPSGKFEHYDTLGVVVSAAMVITIVLIYYLDRRIKRKLKAEKSAAVQADQMVKAG